MVKHEVLRDLKWAFLEYKKMKNKLKNCKNLQKDTRFGLRKGYSRSLGMSLFMS